MELSIILQNCRLSDSRIFELLIDCRLLLDYLLSIYLFSIRLPICYPIVRSHINPVILRFETLQVAKKHFLNDDIRGSRHTSVGTWYHQPVEGIQIQGEAVIYLYSVSALTSRKNPASNLRPTCQENDRHRAACPDIILIHRKMAHSEQVRSIFGHEFTNITISD